MQSLTIIEGKFIYFFIT